MASDKREWEAKEASSIINSSGWTTGERKMKGCTDSKKFIVNISITNGYGWLENVLSEIILLIAALKINKNC